MDNESLKEIARDIKEEARMILPGIHTFFGFQLIAVFNARFETDLTRAEHILHIAAIFCTAIAATLTVAPAAYNRIVEPDRVTWGFVRMATRFLSFSLLPLALGLTIDFYLICRLITHQTDISVCFATFMLLIMGGFWFGLPLSKKRAIAAKKAVNYHQF